MPQTPVQAMAARYLLTVCLVLFTHQAGAGQVHQYTVSVVPQQDPFVIQRNWNPLLKALSLRTGMQFTLLIARSIPEFEVELGKGVADFAYMNPFHAILSRQGQMGYTPLVCNGKEALHGVLVVHRDSGITSLQQLDGQEVVFPSPNAFAASLYMRALLTNKEGIHIKPRYVDTHANVYRNVLYTRAVAGGGVDKTLHQENQGMQKQLHVLYKTPSSVPHPFSAHTRIPTVLAQRVQQALLDIWKDRNERELLKRVQLNAPRIADYQRDYAPLEALGLEKFARRRATPKR
ncbi:phosphate/phosphite/phosphonate ABC transporter substrate-binding protein [Sulfuriflexus mobilis]|uniref:phosphate/phosphite/phosphonate ABC transporter substrate-binding protein n=1 Tax=Sulfuriflexus mobilis TaxID=1811807 RepID=UPI001558C6C8|nr:phosphate/phosphite/phosphonate ABC transporter substrate-binding protein [Sulfuriflexus mobilis]